MGYTDLPLTISLPELLEEGRDDAFRETVSALVAVSAQALQIRTNQASRLRRAHGIELSAAEVTFLWAVVKTADEIGNTNLRRIANYLKISRAAVSATRKNLTKKGIIGTRVDPLDARRQDVFLTEEGIRVLHVSAEEQRVVNDVQFLGLTAEELRCFGDVLEKLIRNGERVLAEQARQ